VDPNGIAADLRPNVITEGDVITRVNRVPVTTLADFERIVGSLKPGDAVVLNLSYHQSSPERIAQKIVQFTYQ